MFNLNYNFECDWLIELSKASVFTCQFLEEKRFHYEDSKTAFGVDLKVFVFISILQTYQYEWNDENVSKKNLFKAKTFLREYFFIKGLLPLYSKALFEAETF